MGPNGLAVWLHSVFSGNFMVFYACSALLVSISSYIFDSIFDVLDAAVGRVKLAQARTTA